LHEYQKSFGPSSRSIKRIVPMCTGARVGGWDLDSNLKQQLQYFIILFTSYKNFYLNKSIILPIMRPSITTKPVPFITYFLLLLLSCSYQAKEHIMTLGLMNVKDEFVFKLFT
jgi:hypothetical protein